VTVFREAGKGSVFTVCLPAAPSTAQTALMQTR
jgi:hypothetical protein